MVQGEGVHGDVDRDLEQAALAGGDAVSDLGRVHCRRDLVRVLHLALACTGAVRRLQTGTPFTELGSGTGCGDRVQVEADVELARVGQQGFGPADRDFARVTGDGQGLAHPALDFQVPGSDVDGRAAQCG